MGISARRKSMRRRRTYENTSLRLAPSSSYYVDAQAAPLDPESALKASVYVDGIRRSAYGNIAKLDPKYGFPQYRAIPQTPRLRVLKCNNQGVPEPDIDPVYGFYSNTSYGKRGICLDVPVDPSWVGAAGSDGSISIWSPDEDALYEFWQAKWLDGGWVSGGPNGLTYDSSATGKVFSIKAGGRYDDVSKAVQGAYPLQNGMQVFGVTAARLMGFPFAITAQEIFNALNPDGSIKNIDAIQHTLGCATSGYHTLSNSIPTSVNSTPRFSWPATMSDNWAAYDDTKPAYDGSKTDDNQTNPATVAVSFGQLMRFPASIDFSTWTPDGWDQSRDQTPLNFARVVGRAIQRRGMRNIDTTGGSMGITAEAPQGAIHQFGYDPWEKIASMFDLTHLPGNYGSNGADYLVNILQLSHLPWEQLEVCVMDYGSDGNAPTILPEYVEPVPLETLAIPPSAAPIMRDDYGTITDTITLTKVDHITWLVGNNTRYAPSSFTGATRDVSYTGGNVVYVRAIADQGYAVLGQTIWSFTFTDQIDPNPATLLDLHFDEADRTFADTEQYGGDGAINYLANVGGGNLIRSQQFVMPMDEADHRALFTNSNAGTHLSFSFRAPALFEQYGRHTIYFTSKYKQDIGFVFDGTTSMAFCESGSGYYLSFEKASGQPSTTFAVGDAVTIELDLPQNVLKTYVNGVLNQSYPITATNRGTTYSVGVTHGAYSVHEFVLDDVVFKKLA